MNPDDSPLTCKLRCRRRQSQHLRRWRWIICVVLKLSLYLKPPTGLEKHATFKTMMDSQMIWHGRRTYESFCRSKEKRPDTFSPIQVLSCSCRKNQMFYSYQKKPKRNLLYIKSHMIWRSRGPLLICSPSKGVCGTSSLIALMCSSYCPNNHFIIRRASTCHAQLVILSTNPKISCLILRKS